MDGHNAVHLGVLCVYSCVRVGGRAYYTEGIAFIRNTRSGTQNSGLPLWSGRGTRREVREQMQEAWSSFLGEHLRDQARTSGSRGIAEALSKEVTWPDGSNANTNLPVLLGFEGCPAEADREPLWAGASPKARAGPRRPLPVL